MRLILVSILFALSTTTVAQVKTHPNNPNVIITDEAPEKWRTLSEEGQYLEAASELLYQVLSDSTRNKHADYWHIGQMYAMSNEYEKARFYMSQAVTEKKDQQWMLYYYGTIAFLERDKAKLERYAAELEDIHTPYYSGNSKTLLRLLENFEKDYLESFK